MSNASQKGNSYWIQLLTGDFYDEETPNRVKELVKHRQLTFEIGECILRIHWTRNKIEHTVGYSIPQAKLQTLRRDYAGVKQWARDHRLMVSNECMEI